MITNDGKELIAKYLLGEAPAFATHIAIGCGATPLGPLDPLGPLNLEQKTQLDCEMTRVPIISKGFVDDNGDTKIVFSAELPAENRYDITEIGLWSAGGNNLAPNSDSKVIFNFQESWESHTASNISAILSEDNNLGTTPDFDTTETIFTLSTSNPLLRATQRVARNEGPRFLNKKIFIRGDTSTITESGSVWTATGTHIHLNSVNFDISNNAPEDILKFAFTLMNKEASSSTSPSTVRILIEFYKNETVTAQSYAKAKIKYIGPITDRYIVANVAIKDLETSADFSASEIRTCRIWVAVEGGDGASSYYVAPDMLRIDNITTINPLYKMVGYAIPNIDSKPITKFQNTNNYAEFRMKLGLI